MTVGCRSHGLIREAEVEPAAAATTCSTSLLAQRPQSASATVVA